MEQTKALYYKVRLHYHKLERRGFFFGIAGDETLENVWAVHTSVGCGGSLRRR